MREELRKDEENGLPGARILRDHRGITFLLALVGILLSGLLCAGLGGSDLVDAAMGVGLGFVGFLTLLGPVVLRQMARSRRFTVQLLRSQQELKNEITERERTERALRENEKRFSLAVRGSSDGIWDWPDVDTDEQWWSPRWYELLGYTNGEIEASYSNFLSLIHPDDIEETKATMRAHFENRRPVDIEYRLRTRSGEYRWFRGRAQAVWDDNGKARRISGSVQDIAKQKKAEERILREKRFSENLIDSSIDGILAYDHKCCCTTWNPGMERIAGVGREQALGKCVFDVFPFLKKSEERKFFYEALAGRTVIAGDRPYMLPETEKQGFFEGYYSPVRDETVYVTKSGQERYLLFEAVPRYDVSGRVVGIQGTAFDFTERKLAEQALEDLNRELETTVERLIVANRELADFAIKHMDKPQGWIKIDCAEEEHFWKFSVADNGPGIEEKYFKKIFRLFQTLVKRDEVDATGIGLSLVKKIVEISGGTIWVESEVGEGTTFFFTLPKQEIGAST